MQDKRTWLAMAAFTRPAWMCPRLAARPATPAGPCLLAATATSLLSSPAAQLPLVPWSLWCTLVPALAVTAAGHALILGIQHKVIPDSHSLFNSLNFVYAAAALAAVYPTAAADLLGLLPGPLPQLLGLGWLRSWAAIKPASMFPLHWPPGWLRAVTAGALFLWLLSRALYLVDPGRTAQGLPQPSPGGAGPAAADSSHHAPALDWLHDLVLGPFWEEVFDRGFVLTALATHIPLWAAVLLSSLLFAAGHDAPVVGQLYLFLAGIAFSAIYLHTGSLAPAIFLHAYNNMHT